MGDKRMRLEGPAGPPRGGRVVGAVDGRADLPPLSDGQYTVCVTVPDSDFLDTCRWQGALVVNAGPDGSPDGPALRTLTLHEGGRLRVRISDPQKLVRGEGRLSEPTNLIVGVRTATGAFHRAEVIASSATQRDLEILVPFGQPLFVWLFTRDLALTGSDGGRVALAGYRVPFQLAPGERLREFVFTVTGLAPTQAVSLAPVP